jgi:hypothetical protein
VIHDRDKKFARQDDNVFRMKAPLRFRLRGVLSEYHREEAAA